MGFIREHAVLLAIFLTVFVLGYVWHLRGRLDAGEAFEATYNYVQPRKDKIDEIAHARSDPHQLVSRWMRGTY